MWITRSPASIAFSSRLVTGGWLKICRICSRSATGYWRCLLENEFALGEKPARESCMLILNIIDARRWSASSRRSEQHACADAKLPGHSLSSCPILLDRGLRQNQLTAGSVEPKRRDQMIDDCNSTSDASLLVSFDHQAFTSQRFGGVSRYFAELISHLPEHGVRPSVFCGLNTNHYTKKLKNAIGVSTPWIPHTVRFRRLINQLSQTSYFSATRPRIVHKTGYSLERLPSNTKIVITVHDMIHESMPAWEPEIGRAKHYWCQRADHIIAISRSTRDDLLRSYGVPASKVTVVHHGTSVLRSRTCGRPLPDEYVLYVGTRARYKNFKLLAAAWAKARGVRRRYRLVCFGGGPLSAEEKSHLKSLGIEDRVTVVAGSDEALGAYYTHASAFVCPSQQEGFGLPLLEAMASGCPVLCSDIRPFREVAGEAAAYFDPASLADISGVLSGYLNDPEWSAESRARGLERSREFSWDVSAARTAEIYHALAV